MRCQNTDSHYKRRRKIFEKCRKINVFVFKVVEVNVFTKAIGKVHKGFTF